MVKITKLDNGNLLIEPINEGPDVQVGEMPVQGCYHEGGDFDLNRWIVSNIRWNSTHPGNSN
jgi:hypothetical protein